MGKKHKVGWTLETLYIHNKTLRESDIRFNAEQDRRYAEGASLRAEALKIKETADLAALTLARESQTYKEQQADAMRDKTLGESGMYATTVSVTKMFDDVKTHLDDALIPVFQFINQFKGASAAQSASNGKVYSIAIVVATLFSGAVVGLLKAFGL